MHNGIYKHRILLLVAFALLATWVAGAQAKSPPKDHKGNSYVLHGKHCKRGYKRVKRPSKTVCVKRKIKKAAKALPRTIRLQAHLSSTVKRNPLNPFQVTYDYSASATSETPGASPVSEPAPLPEGVLAFYNDGILVCAVNVGPQTVGDECPVTYQALGTHRVTTIYTAGEKSATVTETKTIEPLSSETTLGISYDDLPPHETSPGEWRVGTMAISATTLPKGSPQLTCSGAGAGCLETGAQLATDGTSQIPIYARIGSWTQDDAPVFQIKAPKVGAPEWLAPEDFEAGLRTLRAISSPGPGYLPSEAKVPVMFAPHTFPGVYRDSGTLASVTSEFEHLATVGTYSKLSSASTLHVHAAFEGNAANADCLFQARVNGVSADGDAGVEAKTSAVAVEVNRLFEGLGAGPAAIEVWARYVGSSADPDCRSEGLFIVSE